MQATVKPMPARKSRTKNIQIDTTLRQYVDAFRAAFEADDAAFSAWEAAFHANAANEQDLSLAWQRARDRKRDAAHALAYWVHLGVKTADGEDP